MTPHRIDFTHDRARFIDGLAVRAQLPLDQLRQAGTSVSASPDRAGTGAASCYRVDDHLVVWCDPDLEPRLARLRSAHALAPAELRDAMSAAGLQPDAEAVMRALASPPEPLPLATASHVVRYLTADDPLHVDWIRDFVRCCDPDDAAAAGLDSLDDFDEAAITVVVDDVANAAAPGPAIIAYASAMPWEWDSAFGDIAVLVDPRHRRHGLGHHAAAHTARQLLELGRIPLYRHELSNVGSARVADLVGFMPMTALTRFVAAST